MIMNTEQPLFIIGNPRSGTSLLRLILTSHSAIIIPPECGFVIWLYEKYSAWSSADSTCSARRTQFLGDLYACKKFDTWELDRKLLENLIVERSPSDYAALCADVYKAYAQKLSRNVIFWGDKNNFHINCLKDLNNIYPKATFLHIVRDGRDVACSYREVMQHGSSSPYSPNFKTEIRAIAEEWSTNVIQVDNYLAGLDASRQMLVRYEDLVGKTNPTVATICEWLGLSVEDRMLEFHKDNRRMQLEPALTLDWKRRTLEPISEDTVGRYNTMLTLNELYDFTEIAGMALKRFGYVASK